MAIFEAGKRSWERCGFGLQFIRQHGLNIMTSRVVSHIAGHPLHAIWVWTIVGKELWKNHPHRPTVTGTGEKPNMSNTHALVIGY
jgi:hypothetical protein